MRLNNQPFAKREVIMNTDKKLNYHCFGALVCLTVLLALALGARSYTPSDPTFLLLCTGYVVSCSLVFRYRAAHTGDNASTSATPKSSTNHPAGTGANKLHNQTA